MHRPHQGAAAVARAVLVAFLIALVSCGGSAGGPMPNRDGEPGSGRIARVTASSRIYAVDDLRHAGMKVAQEYDPSGLPLATAAVHGFLNQREYEARFYASHADAAGAGARAAALVTGKDARVLGNDIPWSAGATDRRKCVGFINASCVATYNDFVVYGNLVLMCEGRDSETALAECADLIALLPR